jgi:hypothetical protein
MSSPGCACCSLPMRHDAMTVSLTPWQCNVHATPASCWLLPSSDARMVRLSAGTQNVELPDQAAFCAAACVPPSMVSIGQPGMYCELRRPTRQYAFAHCKVQQNRIGRSPDQLARFGKTVRERKEWQACSLSAASTAMQAPQLGGQRRQHKDAGSSAGRSTPIWSEFCSHRTTFT